MTACGKASTHYMYLVFTIEKLHQLLVAQHEQQQLLQPASAATPVFLDMPIIAQSFVNHNATLYKCYVIGSEHTFVQCRASIRNFAAHETDTLFFNSQLPFPDSLKDAEASAKYASKQFLAPELAKPFHEISNAIRETLKLNLFGYDVVIDAKTGMKYIVDVNYLPTYTGVPNVYDMLLAHLKKLVQEKQKQQQQ